MLTKLTREIEGLVESTEPDPNRVSRLKVTYEQLDRKWFLVALMEKLLPYVRRTRSPEQEIEDSESIIAKVIEGKRKIDISCS